MSPLRRISAEELQQILARYRKTLDKANSRAEITLGRVGDRMETLIVRQMFDGTYQVDQEQIVRLQRALRGIIAEGNQATYQAMQQYVPDVTQIALDKMTDTIAAQGALDLRLVSARRIADTFEAIQNAIDNKQILRVSEPYLAQWTAEWNDEWTKTARRVQAAFTRAALTGETNQTIARGLVDDLGRLNIAGRINPDDFAKAFVRTKHTELYNDFGIKIGQEAGLEQYVNIGVPDSRQSEICWEASQVGAHPLEWWEKSRFGVPPRHVMNCRCQLLAVTEQAAKGDLRQPNPKFTQAEEEVLV